MANPSLTSHVLASTGVGSLLREAWHATPAYILVSAVMEALNERREPVARKVSPVAVATR